MRWYDFWFLSILTACGSADGDGRKTANLPSSGAGAPAATGGAANAAGGQSGSSSEAGGAAPAGGAASAGSSPSAGAAGAAMNAPIVSIGNCPSLPGSGWKEISPPGSKYAETTVGMQAIVLRPDMPGVIYAGADSNGIYKSSDCGATWAKVNTGRNKDAMNSGRPWSFVIDPVVPDVMYVIQGYGAAGLWKTTNAGVDWDQVFSNEVLAEFTLSDSVMLDPSDHTHLVVQSHGCTSKGVTCVAESTDSGATWSLVKIPIEWSENSSTVIVDRTTWLHATMAAGLWRTTDSGRTWKNVAPAGAGGAICNYYQPYLFQDKDGAYYLSAWTAPSNQSMMRSKPNDTSSWSLMTFGNSPGGTTIFPTKEHVFWSHQWDLHYFMASRNDLSQWTSFPTPPNVSNGGVYLAYDETHRVLYSSNFKAGLWQIMTD